MALKITKKEDAITVDQLVVCIYGSPGLGKSTLGFSAHKPILLDFDRGAYRAANRRDSVQVESWQDVATITPEDLIDFQTVVVDTAGRALDMLTVDIIRRNPKMGRGGALTIQGYGQLKSEFTAWLKHLRTMGKDVVLIAHSSEEKSGDNIIERLDVQGGSKGEIYKSADAMGRLTLVNNGRVLNFSPTDAAFGKNPGNLKPLTVPEIASQPDFLGDTIDSIKEKLNSLTEEQQERQRIIASWMDKINSADSVDEFSALVADCQGAEKTIQPVIKGAVHKLATKKGFEFDKKSSCYVVAA